METVREIAKSIGVPALLHPLRRPVTWACQHGFLPPAIRKFLPWRWAVEPFTIFGSAWKCEWFPTDFDLVGQQIFWSGLRVWEKETSPVILQQIQQSRCFLDVGANCGIYTVLGCMVNPTVGVVAFEPVPRIFRALANNVKQNGLNSRVTVLNVALSDKNGGVGFHEAEDPQMGSLAVAGYRGQPGRVIQVDCRTMDSVVEELQLVPDFMKIDVEGFEHAVLNGGRKTLGTFRPRIVLEANPGDPANEMSTILSEFGYRFYNITHRGLEERQEISPQEKYVNWLCLP